MLATTLEYLAAASLAISLVQVYLIVTKVWGRKHDRVVAESQSTASNLLGLVTGLPWVVKYGLDGELKLAVVSALWLGLTMFFTLVGLGFWVPGASLGLWARLRGALRLERQEVGELLKSAFRPSDASLILNILRQLSLIDQQLDPREREFVEKFAQSWGLPSPFDSASAAPAEGYAALRSSVEDYLSRRPPHEQVKQLREIIVALLRTDHVVSEQEALVQREISGMLDAHLTRDGAPGLHRVFVVPQSASQDEAIRSLARVSEKIPFRGGSAYLVGGYYSDDYARVMLKKYQSLGFFSVLDASAPGV
jgi:hypothetical protein